MDGVIAETLARDPDLTIAGIARSLDVRQVEFEQAGDRRYETANGYRPKGSSRHGVNRCRPIADGALCDRPGHVT